LIAPTRARETRRPLSEQEARTLVEFGRHFGIEFVNPVLLKLALTHRSYLSVTGQGPRESNERLEFLGDSVLGLVTSEFLYRAHPDEHEGQLTKTKSLLVSKAILSRRALAMGLGRFVLMSHSEVESGGRQRLSILADAFEAVIGAIYLDQGFEAARAFIHQWLLKDTKAIASDERHANYKSHLQEYVQSTFHTHPVYRIRSEFGPDHSKHFVVDVLVGKRALGSGRGRNKKEAEQAAARNALEGVGAVPGATVSEAAEPVASVRPIERGVPARPKASEERGPALKERREPSREETLPEPDEDVDEVARPRRRGRRGGRARRGPGGSAPIASESEGVQPALRSDPEAERSDADEAPHVTPAPRARAGRRTWLKKLDEELEEVGRPEGPLEERHVDPFDWESAAPETRREEPDWSPPADSGAEPAADHELRGFDAERRSEEPLEDDRAEPDPSAADSAPAPSRAQPAPRFGRRTRPRR